MFVSSLLFLCDLLKHCSDRGSEIGLVSIGMNVRKLTVRRMHLFDPSVPRVSDPIKKFNYKHVAMS